MYLWHVINRSDIAILFFSKEVLSATWDVDHVKLSRKCQTLNRRLAYHNLQLVRTLDIDTIVYSSDQQEGNTFGEMLANAHRYLFKQGYQYIIAIGDDGMNMDAIDWKSVLKHALQGDCLLGPDYRRGVYLIGQSSDDFDYHAFKDLPWQTTRLLVDLSEYLGPAGILPQIHDLNSSIDILVAFFLGLTSRHLKGWMIDMVFSSEKVKVYDIVAFFNHPYDSSSVLRGPPAAA